MKSPNRILLIFSVLYFSFSVAAGIKLSTELHQILVHGIVLFWIFTVTRHFFLLRYATARPAPVAPMDPEKLPGVSIIVPAFNEEKVIAAAIGSLLELDYPEYEIIVVDDGSNDSTAQQVREVQRFSQQSKTSLRYIRQRNAGKSVALNTGIKHALYEFLLCIDADSKLKPNVLMSGIRHFSDPRVGAVGGVVEAVNQISLLSMFQQLEYMISLNFVRKALSYFGAVLIVPGPVGLFRRNAILECGGYREGKQVFSEDADLTVRLLAKGWRVLGDDRMKALTEVPETLFALLRQRYRWKRGVYQAFHDNIFELLTGRGFREVMIGCLLFIEAFAYDIVNFGITLFFIASFLRFGEIDPLLALYFALLFLDLTIIALVYRSSGRLIQAVGLFVLQKFSYSYLLQAWGVLALLDEWRSTKMSWDKLSRIGRLQQKHGGLA